MVELPTGEKEERGFFGALAEVASGAVLGAIDGRDKTTHLKDFAAERKDRRKTSKRLAAQASILNLDLNRSPEAREFMAKSFEGSGLTMNESADFISGMEANEFSAFRSEIVNAEREAVGAAKSQKDVDRIEGNALAKVVGEWPVDLSLPERNKGESTGTYASRLSGMLAQHETSTAEGISSWARHSQESQVLEDNIKKAPAAEVLKEGWVHAQHEQIDTLYGSMGGGAPEGLSGLLPGLINGSKGAVADAVNKARAEVLGLEFARGNFPGIDEMQERYPGHTFTEGDYKLAGLQDKIDNASVAYEAIRQARREGVPAGGDEELQTAYKAFDKYGDDDVLLAGLTLEQQLGFIADSRGVDPAAMPRGKQRMDNDKALDKWSDKRQRVVELTGAEIEFDDKTDFHFNEGAKDDKRGTNEADSFSESFMDKLVEAAPINVALGVGGINDWAKRIKSSGGLAEAESDMLYSRVLERYIGESLTAGIPLTEVAAFTAISEVAFEQSMAETGKSLGAAAKETAAPLDIDEIATTLESMTTNRNVTPILEQIGLRPSGREERAVWLEKVRRHLPALIEEASKTGFVMRETINGPVATTVPATMGANQRKHVAKLKALNTDLEPEQTRQALAVEGHAGFSAAVFGSQLVGRVIENISPEAIAPYMNALDRDELELSGLLESSRGTEATLGLKRIGNERARAEELQRSGADAEVRKSLLTLALDVSVTGSSADDAGAFLNNASGLTSIATISENEQFGVEFKEGFEGAESNWQRLYEVKKLMTVNSHLFFSSTAVGTRSEQGLAGQMLLKDMDNLFDAALDIEINLKQTLLLDKEAAEEKLGMELPDNWENDDLPPGQRLRDRALAVALGGIRATEQ